MMKVIRKEPGQDPEIIDIGDDPYAVCDALGGAPLEVMATEDLAILTDRSATFKGERENECAGLMGDELHDTIVVAGVKGIEYCDVPRLDDTLWKAFRAVRYGRADRRHNVWKCRHCGFVQQLEADGPYENGWNVCPACAGTILSPRT